MHFLLILLCFSAAVFAAPPKEALLIANGKYSHFAGLAHPSPDAAKLSAALEQLGFRVRVVRDGNREQMLDAISEFERGLRNTGAIAFFHYGGHGVQVDGKNYLLPADADIPDERRVATRAVALDEVMTAMDASAARASIIVIDACRDNPLPAGSGRNLARGLSVVGMKPKNSIVIYSAEAGSKALDGLFTPILAVALQQKGRTIDQVMKSVRSEVYAKSSGQQTPGEYNQLFEELFLGEPAGDNLSAEKIFAAKPAPTPYATPTPFQFKNIGEMVEIPAGDITFRGQIVKVPTFKISRYEVTISEYATFLKDLEANPDKAAQVAHPNQPLGKSHIPIGWADMTEINPPNPGYYTRAKRWGRYQDSALSIDSPVFGVDWYDAYAYAKWKGQRLPTEQEWERAARGDKGFKNPWGDAFDNKLANTGYDFNPDPKAEANIDGFKRWSPVDKPDTDKSAFGVQGMAGNVFEWTDSWAEDAERPGDKVPVYRGSSWKARDESTAVRRGTKLTEFQSDDALGFRTAEDVQ